MFFIRGDFGDLVSLIDKHHLRLKLFCLFWFHLGICHNNNMVANLHLPGRCAIQAYHAARSEERRVGKECL